MDQNLNVFESESLEVMDNLGGNNISVYDKQSNSDNKKIIIASFVSNKQILVAAHNIFSIAKKYQIHIKSSQKRRDIQNDWLILESDELIMHFCSEQVREYNQLDTLS